MSEREPWKPDHYRALFETIDEGFCIIELIGNADGDAADWRYVEVNSAFERQTGLVDVLGKRGSEVVPGTETHWRKLFGEVARSGESNRLEQYHEATRRWYEVFISRFDAADRPTVCMVFNDITERKRSEAALRESERHARKLLAELQHRVRNTLAVVRSIARRTADNSTNVDDMLAHFQGRLDAFSRVQAALTRHPDGLVDLKSLIEDELIAHAAREGEQFRIHGPDVRLEPKAAERISLAIHELATNAVKHGALINGSGRLDIRWQKEADDPQMLRFEWLESGVDLAGRPVNADGFGMELLRTSLPYDLQAETRVELGPKGLRFELRMRM